jgi:hypothetical protein
LLVDVFDHSSLPFVSSERSKETIETPVLNPDARSKPKKTGNRDPDVETLRLKQETTKSKRKERTKEIL